MSWLVSWLRKSLKWLKSLLHGGSTQRNGFCLSVSGEKRYTIVLPHINPFFFHFISDLIVRFRFAAKHTRQDKKQNIFTPSPPRVFTAWFNGPSKRAKFYRPCYRPPENEQFFFFSAAVERKKKLPLGRKLHGQEQRAWWDPPSACLHARPRANTPTLYGWAFALRCKKDPGGCF